MLKFYSLLVGENPELTKNFQESSKKKIIVNANLLMIPVLLWLVNGFLISRVILENGLGISIMIGLFIGLIIFLFERSIIIAKSNLGISIIRIILGMIIAVLGSVTIDEVLFKNDIDNIVNEMVRENVDKRKNKIDSTYNSVITLQRIKVDSTKSKLDQLTEDFQKEADGNGGSGLSGLGNIAKSKRDLMYREQKYYEIESSKLDTLLSNFQNDKISAEKEYKESFNDKGLLLRVEALAKLISNNLYCKIIFILYFSLVLLLESMVVLFKLVGEKSVDEKLEGFRDKIVESRYEKLSTGKTGSNDIKNSNEILNQVASLYKK